MKVKGKETTKKKRVVYRERERERWIWSIVWRIRDLELVGTASTFT